MSKFYIGASIRVGQTQHFAGELIDDASFDTTVLTKAGAVLWPAGDATVAAAAALAQIARKKGQDERQCDEIMMAAMSASSITRVEKTFPGASLPAKTVAVHAQIAGGAALNATSGFTVPFPQRALQVLIGVGGVACTITVKGTDCNGNALTKTAAVTAAGTFAVGGGADVFETVTSMTSDVDPVGTTDLQTSDAFGLGVPYTAASLVTSADGVIETPSVTSPTTGGIKPNTIPNGTHSYDVRFNRA